MSHQPIACNSLPVFVSPKFNVHGKGTFFSHITSKWTASSTRVIEGSWRESNLKVKPLKPLPWQFPCQRTGSRRSNLTVKSHHNLRPNNGQQSSPLRVSMMIAVHALPSSNALSGRRISNASKRLENPYATLCLTRASSVQFAKHKGKCHLKYLRIKSTWNVIANNSMRRAHNISLTFKPSGQV